MEFKPLYYGERLRVINPKGDVGLVTLWSKVESVEKVLVESGVDLSSQTSRVAVMANLYGNGLPHMLRNLLHNPQIKHLVVCGKNLSGSREWLLNFFEQGLEEVEFLGARVLQIKGTNRVIDSAVLPEDFPAKPSIRIFGDVSDPLTQEGIKTCLTTLEPPANLEGERVEPPGIPEPVLTRFPSHPGAHLVHRRTPDEAWRELIFRLYRFGHRNTVAKSTGPEERIELSNMHVVVDDPSEESEEVLAKSGFSLDKFRDYQVRILDPVLPQDLDYTYGWLLRRGMEEEPVDSVAIITERLARDPESRHAYATLWNNSKHLPSGKSTPCFASLFFRRIEGKLTLTATFRVHNAADAWPENFYGLAAIQKEVAEGAGMERGFITVVSHSISLDPSSLEKAKRIAEERKSDDDLDPESGKRELRFDPNGSFTVTFDKATWELVVEHSYQGMKLGEYRGKTAEQIEAQLSRDLAVSIVPHAFYLGREIARKEHEMKAARKAE